MQALQNKFSIVDIYPQDLLYLNLLAEVRQTTIDSYFCMKGGLFDEFVQKKENLQKLKLIEGVLSNQQNMKRLATKLLVAFLMHESRRISLEDFTDDLALRDTLQEIVSRELFQKIDSTTTFPAEQPIQMVFLAEDKKTLKFNPAVLQMLSDKPVAVLSIAGQARGGKSYFLNRIFGTQTGFALGGAVQSCTRGIWGGPQQLTASDGSQVDVLLMDTEGLGACDNESIKGETYDAQIFTLAVLASSCFIFNQVNVIDERSLDKIDLIAGIANNITEKRKGQEDSDIMEPPLFVYLIRDYFLNLPNDNPDTYFDECLSENAKKPSRSALKTFFPKRICRTLVRPVVQENTLRNLDKTRYEDLRSDFRMQLEAIVTEIKNYLKAHPKKLNGSQLTGQQWGSLIEIFVNMLNKEVFMPTMEESWSSLSRAECLKAKKLAKDAYEQEMNSLNWESIIELEKLFHIHRKAFELATDVYMKHSIGNFQLEYYEQLRKEAINYNKDNTAEVIGGWIHSYYQKNYQKSEQLCANTCNTLRDKFQHEIAKSSDILSIKQHSAVILDEYMKESCGPAKSKYQETLVMNLDNCVRRRINQLSILQTAHKELLELQEMRDQQLDDLARKIDAVEATNRQIEEERKQYSKDQARLLEKMKKEHEKKLADEEARYADKVNKLQEKFKNDQQALQTALQREKDKKQQDYNTAVQAFQQQEAQFQQKMANLQRELEGLRLPPPPPRRSCCFSASSTVMLENGMTKEVAKLEVGDKVQSFTRDGSIVFSEVYYVTGHCSQGWNFVNISFESPIGTKCIRITKNHLLYVSKNENFPHDPIRAALVRPGDTVWVPSLNGNQIQAVKVLAVERTSSFGMFAVETMSGNIITDGLCCSSYEIKHSWQSNDALPLKLLYKVFPALLSNRWTISIVSIYDKFMEFIATKLHLFGITD